MLRSSDGSSRANLGNRKALGVSGGSRRGRRWLGRTAIVLVVVGLGLPVVAVLPWRWLPPPTTAFVLRERMATDLPVHYRWVPREEISSNLAIAAVAAEDQRFPDHRGFDWVAIRDALEESRDGGRVRGGSTISQQVAKNLYLWPGQNWVRKGIEAYLTIWIELLWPKPRVLEIYLNVAEFGPGVFGVGAASERLLHTSPSELSSYEASVLAAVLPSPKRMSAERPSDYVRSRASQIQAAARSLGGAGYLGDAW